MSDEFVNWRERFLAELDRRLAEHQRKGTGHGTDAMIHRAVCEALADVAFAAQAASAPRPIPETPT